MRCPACTQRNSVAAKNCKFCGSKFKKKTSPVVIKVVAGVAAVGLCLGLASAVGSMFSGAPAPKLKPIAERMAAGPKSPEEAQIMRSELDNAVIKYLEQNGSLSSADLLTKLQTEVPSSAFEVLVFDLPNQIKLIELTCVMQPSDYLVVPAKSGVKVSRVKGLQVFDEARLVSTTPDPCLVLIGHTTGDRPKEAQVSALALLPSGEVADRSDKIVPPIQGPGSAAFIGTSNNIKVERGIVSSAKEQKLFDASVNFKDEPFITNLTWKNGKYEANSSMGTNEVGALYAVASSLVDPTAIDSYRQQLSPEVRETIKGMADKPVTAPGNFKIAKVSKDSSGRRKRSRRSSDSGNSFLLTSPARAFEVGLVKAGRWSVTGLKETSAPESVATEPVSDETGTAGATTAAVTPVPQETELKVVEKQAEKVAVVSPPAESREDKRRKEREAERESAKEREREKKRELAKAKEREEREAREEKKRELAREKEREEKKQRELARKKESEPKSSGGSRGETTSRVTMRTGPARGNKSIFDIGRGESVRVLGEQNGWVKISANGREGWVYGSYVKRNSSSKSSERSEKTASKREPEKVATKRQAPPPAKPKEKPPEKEKVASSSKSTKSTSRKPQVSSSKSHSADHSTHVAPDEPDFVP